MAGLDGTGPEGRGQLTGRGLGNCPVEGVTYGRNKGQGRRFASCNAQKNQGMRRGFNRIDTSEDELETLKNRISELEEKLK